MNEYFLSGTDLSGQQVRQVMLGQIDNVLDLINNSETGFDETIHSIRKSIKRIRAMMRMIRFPLGEKIYNQENIFLRDINRTISAIRDSRVNIEVFDTLTERLLKPEEKSVDAVNELLADEYQQLKEQFDVNNKGKEQLRSLLKDARKRLAIPELDNIRKGSVMRGIRKTYRRGKKSLAIAGHDLNDRNLHELRKQVKHLWYQMQLIRFLWDPYFASLEKSIETVSDGLGEDHDLTELRLKLTASDIRDKVSSEFTDDLLNLIGEKQQIIRENIWPEVKRIYAEAPGTFVRRINSYRKIIRETVS